MNEFWEVRAGHFIRKKLCGLLNHKFTSILIQTKLNHRQVKKNLYGRVTLDETKEVRAMEKKKICTRCHFVTTSK